jgi:hypothetical protein
MGCYCEERQRNPKMTELLKELPPGYCGVCSVCGAPGHTRAHPSLPLSDAWCDAHYAALSSRLSIRPDTLLKIAIILVALFSLGASLWRLWR